MARNAPYEPQDLKVSRAPATPKPFLKWAGGKRQLLPQLRALLPAFDRYFEPFIGAGALLFDTRPANAVVGDFNTQLITTYSAIRDRFDATRELLRQHRDRFSKDYYYQVREMDRSESFSALAPEVIAARFIFLNKTCYNGLYRVNSRGQFNVPAGTYKNPAIFEEEVLRAVHEYLRNNAVTLTTGDFQETVKDAAKGDFVYFDPPYHSPDKTNFTSYQAGGFGEEEQERLAACYAELAARGVKCLLSNSDTPLIKKLYGSYTILTVRAKRPINNQAHGRGHVNELVVKSWA